ncbi:MAG: DNA-directed RNA polymerase subunit L [Desulfurococcales archaeon]|nr:DNA-directed RNA polymerase subunit L [Desulfurococcales archaeon]MEB3758910.1 DNA-directed RNA polymerase subunit L [Desulfurococcales archaeon]MEB3772492.1 DNA-directed RNA polymerase subunit L [Desulfurococcales archaeon]MEB3798955.1 DNA-directed RNA polymerase subunit L [Desulfurococcales archaeon]
MDVQVVEKSDTKLVFKLEGEDHTIANLIVGYLKRINGIKRAFYDIPHPLTGAPVITILTDGSISPVEALSNALNSISKDLAAFREKYEKSLERQG